MRKEDDAFLNGFTIGYLFTMFFTLLGAFIVLI